MVVAVVSTEIPDLVQAAQCLGELYNQDEQVSETDKKKMEELIADKDAEFKELLQQGGFDADARLSRGYRRGELEYQALDLAGRETFAASMAAQIKKHFAFEAIAAVSETESWNGLSALEAVWS